MGDSFCGSCGLDLTQYLDESQADFDKTINQAKQFAFENEFNKALAFLTAFADKGSLIFKSRKNEIDSLVESYRQRRDENKINAQTALENAQLYVEQFAFSKAVNELERVPEAFRNSAILELLDLAKTKSNDVKRLAEEIKAMLAKKDFLAAFPKIESLRRLRPKDENLPKLSADIVQHLTGQVEKLRSLGKHQQGLKLIKKLGEIEKLNPLRRET